MLKKTLKNKKELLKELRDRAKKAEFLDKLKELPETPHIELMPITEEKIATTSKRIAEEIEETSLFFQEDRE